jgi:hypothetical protein
MPTPGASQTISKGNLVYLESVNTFDWWGNGTGPGSLLSSDRELTWADIAFYIGNAAARGGDSDSRIPKYSDVTSWYVPSVSPTITGVDGWRPYNATLYALYPRWNNSGINNVNNWVLTKVESGGSTTVITLDNTYDGGYGDSSVVEDYTYTYKIKASKTRTRNGTSETLTSTETTSTILSPLKRNAPGAASVTSTGCSLTFTPESDYFTAFEVMRSDNDGSHGHRLITAASGLWATRLRVLGRIPLHCLLVLGICIKYPRSKQTDWPTEADR